MADVCSSLDLSAPLASPRSDPAEKGDAELRDVLKRCSPATQEAARDFRRTGDTRHLPQIVQGVVARYVDAAARAKIANGDDTLRLVEDLGVDSLTLMEIVSLAEEVLQISMSDDELRPLRTLGEVKDFMLSKVQATRASAA